MPSPVENEQERSCSTAASGVQQVVLAQGRTLISRQPLLLVGRCVRTKEKICPGQLSPAITQPCATKWKRSQTCHAPGTAMRSLQEYDIINWSPM